MYIFYIDLGEVENMHTEIDDAVYNKVENIFYNNGYVVQQIKYPLYIDAVHIKSTHYKGIDSCISWPLENNTDEISVKLTQEVTTRWLNSSRYGLWTITDMKLLKQYITHCYKLDIPIRILAIESTNRHTISGSTSGDEIRVFLGYEYIDTNMQTSCSYEDMYGEEKLFCDVISKLNNNYLFGCVNDVEQYLRIRETLSENNYGFEEYYFPSISKLSEVNIISRK